MSKVLEELERSLAEKDRRIEELEEKVETMSYHDEWSWRQIRSLSKEENLDLPMPRLELRYRILSNYTHFVDYGLVYQHLLGDVQFVPIGCTKISGKVTHLATPFRDGGHMFNDMYELKLRGFVVDGTTARELSFADSEVPLRVLDKVQKEMK